jgi:hypothetical protein
MTQAKGAVDIKHDILRDILESLGLEEKPEYFSTGSTITAEALKVIRDEIQRRKGILRGIEQNLNQLI